MSQCGNGGYNQKMINSRLAIYEFRAAYLAGGPNAANLIGEEFAPLPVDSDAILNSGSAENLDILAQTNINFIISPFDLGFPSEERQPQKDWFAGMTRDASALGIETLALITPSSYAPRGSYKNAAWAARLPNGKTIHYSHSSGRLMACWTSDEWTENICNSVGDAIGAGAAGVALDSICFGASPLFIDREFTGPSGCRCRRCRDAFRAFIEKDANKPFPIPDTVELNSDKFVKYATWRAGVVREKLNAVKNKLTASSQDALLAVIAPHLAYLPTFIMYGLDPEWALSQTDICILEHHRAPNLSKKGLLYESPGLKVAYASSSNPITASIAYPFGPADDIVPPPAMISSAFAGSFSCGAAPIIRCGEFRGAKDIAGDFISEPRHKEQRESVAALFNWLDKNPDIYEGSAPVARVAILFSWDIMKTNPGPFTAAFYSILQTLTEVQIPVKVISEENIDAEDLSDIRVIILPEASIIGAAGNERLIDLFKRAKIIYTGEETEFLKKENATQLDSEFMRTAFENGSGFASGRFGRAIIKKIYRGGSGLFGGFPISRRAGLPPALLANVGSMNYNYLPPAGWKTLRETVVRALKEFPDDFTVEGPPYIHISEWKKSPNSFFHIVNLIQDFPGPDQAAIRFPSPVSARIIDTAKNKITYINNENTIVVAPKPYLVVEIKNRYPETA